MARTVDSLVADLSSHFTGSVVKAHSRGAAIVSDQICVACEVARKPVASEPADLWHQIVFYKCPSCGSVLKCVERKGPRPNTRGNRKSAPNAE